LLPSFIPFFQLKKTQVSFCHLWFGFLTCELLTFYLTIFRAVLGSQQNLAEGTEYPCGPGPLTCRNSPLSRAFTGQYTCLSLFSYSPSFALGFVLIGCDGVDNGVLVHVHPPSSPNVVSLPAHCNVFIILCFQGPIKITGQWEALSWWALQPCLCPVAYRKLKSFISVNMSHLL
jgi:hypothetical protein